MMLNMVAGWIGFLGGCVSGALPGLFFFGENWLGGYASWKRRMVRLAHISFFGIGLINLCFALTVHTVNISAPVAASRLLILGAVTMPLICYLSALQPLFRHAFAVPAGALTLAVFLTTWELLNL